MSNICMYHNIFGARCGLVEQKRSFTWGAPFDGGSGSSRSSSGSAAPDSAFFQNNDDFLFSERIKAQQEDNPPVYPWREMQSLWDRSRDRRRRTSSPEYDRVLDANDIHISTYVKQMGARLDKRSWASIPVLFQADQSEVVQTVSRGDEPSIVNLRVATCLNIHVRCRTRPMGDEDTHTHTYTNIHTLSFPPLDSNQTEYRSMSPGPLTAGEKPTHCFPSLERAMMRGKERSWRGSAFLCDRAFDSSFWLTRGSGKSCETTGLFASIISSRGNMVRGFRRRERIG